MGIRARGAVEIYRKQIKRASSGDPGTADTTVNDSNIAMNRSGMRTGVLSAVIVSCFVCSVARGQTWVWTERDPASGTADWRSVASSSDGTKLVACASGDRLYTSTDSGVTWTARESNRNWRSVASSSDGTKLVACVDNGQI